MNELIFLVEDAPEGGFTARALGQAIFTEADDMPTLREQIRDAVQCHFDKGQSPSVIRASAEMLRQLGKNPDEI